MFKLMYPYHFRRLMHSGIRTYANYFSAFADFNFDFTLVDFVYLFGEIYFGVFIYLFETTGLNPVWLNL